MTQQFNFPTTILYGAGCTTDLPGRLQETTAVLVSDPGLEKIGLVDRVEKVLSDKGMVITRFTAVDGNPTEENCIAGAQVFKDSGAESLIALGGGSPMDAAKVIAVLATHDGDVTKFDDATGGDANITNPLPKIYTIPTTAGTGSEVGRAGVVTATKTRRKTVVFHPDLLPSIAVLDPELSVGLPAHITAATGLDAFSHGFEAYLAKGFHPMCDSIGIGAMELVVQHLPTAIADGSNLEARGNMLVAASMGATAFQKGLGAVHSLAHPMSTHYGTHHGLANALLMPVAIGWQWENRRSEFPDDLVARYARVATLIAGVSRQASDLAGELRGLAAKCGITRTLVDEGLKESEH